MPGGGALVGAPANPQKGSAAVIRAVRPISNTARDTGPWVVEIVSGFCFLAVSLQSRMGHFTGTMPRVKAGEKKVEEKVANFGENINGWRGGTISGDRLELFPGRGPSCLAVRGAARAWQPRSAPVHRPRRAPRHERQHRARRPAFEKKGRPSMPSIPLRRSCRTRSLRAMLRHVRKT